MMISALGTLHINILTAARIPFAMARDGLFFAFAKRVQPTFRSPSGGLLLVGGVAALLGEARVAGDIQEAHRRWSLEAGDQSDQGQLTLEAADDVHGERVEIVGRHFSIFCPADDIAREIDPSGHGEGGAWHNGTAGVCNDA